MIQNPIENCFCDGNYLTIKFNCRTDKTQSQMHSLIAGVRTK